MLGTEVAKRIIKLCTDAQVELPKMFCCSSEEDNLMFRKIVSEAGMQATINKPVQYGQLK